MASILVCDDQRSICEMLDISLRKDGHRVETVNGGEAAKKKLSSANYELLITDIKMPQTDGIEVLRFARQSSPETFVVFYGSYKNDGSFRRGFPGKTQEFNAIGLRHLDIGKQKFVVG